MKRFSIVDQLAPELWDEFVYKHPKGSIFHTSSMHEVFSKVRKERPFFRAALDGGGSVVALLVAVRVQTLPFPFGPVSSRSIFYAEPLCMPDALGVEALEALIAEHDARLGRNILFTEVRPLKAAGGEKEALTNNGYQYKNYLNFLVHLNRPKEDLWQGLTRQCRQGVRASERKGVTIADATTQEGVDVAYSLIRDTYNRARVPVADKSLFTAAYDIFQPQNSLKIFVAYWHDAPIGTKIVLLYRERAFAWYSGHCRIRGVYPAENLGWHAIEWSNEHHYSVYDWGGAGWPDIPYGVRDFKAKFGGELVDFGRYRKIHSPLRFAAAERVYEGLRLLRSEARRLRRTGPARAGADIGARGEIGLKLREWYARRGPRYVAQRAKILLQRYQLSPAQAEARIVELIEKLAQRGCAPTFPTPGGVVERNRQFIHRLQDLGAEIAVHGYEHLDLSVYPPAQAKEQLERAVDAFARQGIEVHGFRCPYLSCTDGLLDVLPTGMFEYSSNKAIWWDVLSSQTPAHPAAVFDTLYQFYQPEAALQATCLPRSRPNLLEIPICLPDDLQMHDGLNLDSEAMAQNWGRMLNETHQRGELCVLQFHPEISSDCAESFLELLDQARRLRPAVWVCRLRDIAAWWREKSAFKAHAVETPSGLHISFECSARATILARDLAGVATEPTWSGRYRRVQATQLDLPLQPRPFVGVAHEAPAQTISLLQERGYIVDSGDTATQCAVYLDATTLENHHTERSLVAHIEESAGPLVRFGLWPDGARSALSLTGDLDALSLSDYARRLLSK